MKPGQDRYPKEEKGNFGQMPAMACFVHLQSFAAFACREDMETQCWF
jgi:hypothetical protein